MAQCLNGGRLWTKRRCVHIAVGLLLGLGTAPLHAQDKTGISRARAAVEFLDQQWGTPNDWRGAAPWQRFVIVDALIEYQARSGDGRWAGKIAAAVRNHPVLYGNDDELWAVIANVHAWRLDHDPALLAYASSTYRRIVTTYWDDRCGGGLWWDYSRTYKNAITNELLIYASTQLFLATGQNAYRDWALRGWSWFAQSSMIAVDGMVNDGLDANCHNNGGPQFTYNQGVLIGGLNDIARITDDDHYRTLAVRTAIAATRRLSAPNGVLHEPIVMIGADGPMFKGIFAYHLGHLRDDLAEGPESRELTAWVGTNADAVWRSSGSGARAIGSDWSDMVSVSSPAAQASGIDMLLAATRR